MNLTHQNGFRYFSGLIHKAFLQLLMWHLYKTFSVQPVLSLCCLSSKRRGRFWGEKRQRTFVKTGFYAIWYVPCACSNTRGGHLKTLKLDLLKLPLKCFNMLLFVLLSDACLLMIPLVWNTALLKNKPFLLFMYNIYTNLFIFRIGLLSFIPLWSSSNICRNLIFISVVVFLFYINYLGTAP